MSEQCQKGRPFLTDFYVKFKNVEKIYHVGEIDIHALAGVDFEIEKELGIEVVGDTKVKIMVEDDEDKWEVFDDEATDDTMKEIDEEVNEDFLE